MILDHSNYFSPKANRLYMSNSQYSNFLGTDGVRGCESRALAIIKEEWVEEPTTPMLVGSFVDAHFAGTLDIFKAQHPEILTQKGELRADYKKAEQLIQRIERDPFFLQTLSGEKQVIMEGVFAGTKWKIAIDSLLDNAIVDLKTAASIRKAYWIKDQGHVSFIEYWSISRQLAIYQRIVEINTGKRLPVFVSVISKEAEPDIEVIGIDQNRLDECIIEVETNMPRVLQVKSGEVEAERCGVCPYCRNTKVLEAPVHFSDIILNIN